MDGSHVSKEKFDWSWDDFELTRPKLEKMVYEESLFFHPEKVLTKKENVSSIKEHFKKYKYHR